MKFWRQSLVLFLNLWLLPVVALAAITTIDNSRISSTPDLTRVVLVLSAPADYKYFSLKNPDRVVIDVANAQMKTNLNKLDVSNTPIKTIRVSKQGDQVRIVLDLKKSQIANAFILRAEEHYRDRLVLDLTNANSADSTIVKPEKIPQTLKTPEPTMTLPYKNVKPRDIVVVIDPGHGGKDPGAIGSRGVYEKNVVLAISKRLYTLLDKQPGYKPQMTRSGDYYISLRDRLRIARKQKADIFVAIHADAFDNPASHGASVYALSDRGASSEAARWLAAKENYSELGGIDLNDTDNSVRSVLIDLSQTATISESLQLGDLVLNQLGDFSSLHHDKVEQARFVVLKSPDIPSILVETGFLSNNNEAKRLNSPQYQQQVANALMRGISQYFNKNPPPGTWVAMSSQNNKTYIVSKGDSLGTIARNHNVSVMDLRAANNLQDENIQVGQQLTIPAA